MRSMSYLLCSRINYKISTSQSVRHAFYRSLLTCTFQPRSDVCPQYVQQPHVAQYYSTVSTTLSAVWKQMRFTPRRMRVSKSVLRKSSLRAYLCCAELPDYSLFMKELELEDTFNSWCKLLYLHVWIALVRLVQEGAEGKFLYTELVNHMWKDIDIKSKKLAYSSQRREGVLALYEHFKPTLVSYDEGALGNDSVLAGAIWRNIFDTNCDDVSHLELMVDYTRRQLAHIDQRSSTELLTTGLIRFLPLRNSLDADERQETIISEIKRRV